MRTEGHVQVHFNVIGKDVLLPPVISHHIIIKYYYIILLFIYRSCHTFLSVVYTWLGKSGDIVIELSVIENQVQLLFKFIDHN